MNQDYLDIAKLYISAIQDGNKQIKSIVLYDELRKSIYEIYGNITELGTIIVDFQQLRNSNIFMQIIIIKEETKWSCNVIFKQRDKNIHEMDLHYKYGE